jgi:hypothetical protein
MMKNGKENGPCRAMCLGLHVGFLRLFLESSELQSSMHRAELSRANKKRHVVPLDLADLAEEC